MRTIASSNLRARLTPPPARQDRDRTAQTEKVLRLATELFGVTAAALVASTPGGLRVQATWVSGAWNDADALTAARRLLDLPSPDDAVRAQGAGVLEEIGAERGYRAAAPVLSPEGETLGALCLVDPDRRTLLSGLQRRLLAEFGDLFSSAFEIRPTLPTQSPSPDAADLLLMEADRYPQPVAIFDAEGQCLLRNRLFASLMRSNDTTIAGNAAISAIADARGREAEWLAEHLAPATMPVGIYRVCRADGAWICVEERRTSRGRSLVARFETAAAYGDYLDGGALFERCPAPMFLFDRETRRPMAVNAAALAFYGWDRDAFLALPLDAIGPFGSDPDPDPGSPLALDKAELWVHRSRRGDGLPVAGRTVALTYRGRASVLVTVVAHASMPENAVAA